MHTDSYLFFAVILFANCVLPSLWVAFDAARNRISTDGKPYSTLNGAAAWFIGSLLFPMVGLLFYLIQRSERMSEQRRAAYSPR